MARALQLCVLVFAACAVCVLAPLVLCCRLRRRQQQACIAIARVTLPLGSNPVHLMTTLRAWHARPATSAASMHLTRPASHKCLCAHAHALSFITLPAAGAVNVLGGGLAAGWLPWTAGARACLCCVIPVTARTCWFGRPCCVRALLERRINLPASAVSGGVLGVSRAPVCGRQGGVRAGGVAVLGSLGICVSECVGEP